MNEVYKDYDHETEEKLKPIKYNISQTNGHPQTHL